MLLFHFVSGSSFNSTMDAKLQGRKDIDSRLFCACYSTESLYHPVAVGVLLLCSSQDITPGFCLVSGLRRTEWAVGCLAGDEPSWRFQNINSTLL